MTYVYVVIGVVGVVLILRVVFSHSKDTSSQKERDARIQAEGGDMNRLEAWRVKTNARAIAAKDDALYEKIAASHRLAHAPEVEDAKHEGEMRGFDVTEARDKNTIKVYEVSTADGETPAFHETKKTKMLDTDEAIRKDRGLKDNEIWAKAEEANRRTDSIVYYTERVSKVLKDSRKDRFEIIEEKLRLVANTEILDEERVAKIAILEEEEEVRKEHFKHVSERYMETSDGVARGGDREDSPVMGGSEESSRGEAEDEVSGAGAWSWKGASDAS